MFGRIMLFKVASLTAKLALIVLFMKSLPHQFQE